MIYIKAWYADWRQVSHETAKHFVEYMLMNMPAVKESDRANVINEKHLRGITVEELLCQ